MKASIVMSIDLRLLAYSAFICILMWVPYILLAIKTFGLFRVVGYPVPSYDGMPQWGQRLYRAHMNLVENLAPFAALVIIAHITGTANETTALGARLFFWARLAQIVLHTAGIPWGRTIFFVIGWVGNILIFSQIIGY
ncbi:MAG: MAPEG family protein [Rhodospirillales bacterium]|nr:MAPEG family protein [Alphaproteobacteria bacterium]MBL6947713.1 MAPEG family protein [Rhodospirillales bacterium]